MERYSTQRGIHTEGSACKGLGFFAIKVAVQAIAELRVLEKDLWPGALFALYHGSKEQSGPQRAIDIEASLRSLQRWADLEHEMNAPIVFIQLSAFLRGGLFDFVKRFVCWNVVTHFGSHKSLNTNLTNKTPREGNQQKIPSRLRQ